MVAVEVPDSDRSGAPPMIRTGGVTPGKAMGGSPANATPGSMRNIDKSPSMSSQLGSTAGLRSGESPGMTRAGPPPRSSFLNHASKIVTDQFSNLPLERRVLEMERIAKEKEAERAELQHRAIEGDGDAAAQLEEMPSMPEDQMSLKLLEMCAQCMHACTRRACCASCCCALVLCTSSPRIAQRSYACPCHRHPALTPRSHYALQAVLPP